MAKGKQTESTRGKSDKKVKRERGEVVDQAIEEKSGRGQQLKTKTGKTAMRSTKGKGKKNGHPRKRLLLPLGSMKRIDIAKRCLALPPTMRLLAAMQSISFMLLCLPIYTLLLKNKLNKAKMRNLDHTSSSYRAEIKIKEQ